MFNSLFRAIYLLTKNHNHSIRFIAVLYLPGTILHELAHLLVAGMLLVPVGELEVIPKMHENQLKLGSVQIAKTDPIRRMLIGVAPILFGIGAIFSIFYFFEIFFPNPVWWQIGLLLYAVFVMSNTMYSSKKDLEGALAFSLTLLVVGVILLGLAYLFNMQISYEWIFNLDYGFADNFLGKIILLLAIPLIINLAIIIISRALYQRSI